MEKILFMLSSPKKEEDSKKKSRKAITLKEVGSCIVDSVYNIRGDIYLRAAELEKIRQAGGSLPFRKFYYLQYADPPSAGQPPLTFVRQVISATLTPALLETGGFSEDVKKRVKHYYDNIPGGMITAYADIKGYRVFRETVARYLEKRDGFPSDPDSIYLFNGASDGILTLLQLIFSRPNIGALMPQPGYPEFSTLAHQFNGTVVYYPLNEEEGWSLRVEQMEEEYLKAKEKGIDTKLMIIINPNNPTCSVLPEETIRAIIKFAYDNDILILVDEVYQLNIHSKTKKFVSFRKIACSMGEPYSKMEMVSFDSLSKGYISECGLRGGYAEFMNMDPEVMAQFEKMREVCSVNIAGCVAMDIMCNPPDYNNASKETVDLFVKERDAILKTGTERVKQAEIEFNKTKYVRCQPIEGGMFAFPRVFMTQSAIDEAGKRKLEPSEFFCHELLEHTGILVTPGNVFSPKPGMYHFRILLLIWKQEELMEMLNSFNKFVLEFFAKYP